MNEQNSLGTARIEAFSDGVIAIIITIMVLEIHPPRAPTLDALLALWPTLLAYLLSFAYIAIYWVNHHRLLGFARRYTVPLSWANMLLLFSLSLVPISTEWLGQYPLQTIPTATYLVTLILPAVAYRWLDAEVLTLIADQHRKPQLIIVEQIKQYASLAIYALGIGLAFFYPALSLVCAATVSVIWLIPEGPIDRLLTRYAAARHR